MRSAASGRERASRSQGGYTQSSGDLGRKYELVGDWTLFVLGDAAALDCAADEDSETDEAEQESSAENREQRD